MNVNSRCFVASQILLRGNFSAPQKMPSVKRYQVCLKLANIPQGFIGASPFWGLYGKGACYRCQSDLIQGLQPTPAQHFVLFANQGQQGGERFVRHLQDGVRHEKNCYSLPAFPFFSNCPEQINGWPCPLLALSPLTISTYLIFVIFPPRAQFFAKFFSTQKRVNRTKTDFATKQRKLQKNWFGNKIL